MKTTNLEQVEGQIVNVNEQKGGRLNWRHYLAMGAGAVALGGVWALADPEGARAFGQGLVDAVTPEFKSLFDNPHIGSPDNGGNFIPIIDHPVVTPQDGGPVMS